MEFLNDGLDAFSMDEGGRHGGRLGRKRRPTAADDDTVYKSKNLQAERRRRQKLSDRLLELRALVPIITNMNKATIITDAITYIKELQRRVGDLGDQLLQMDAISEEETGTRVLEIDAAKEMLSWGIKPEVQVTHIDRNKLWVKIIHQKKRGGFTKLMESMSLLGFDINDASVATSKGAILFTSCVEGIHGGDMVADQIRELLVNIISSI